MRVYTRILHLEDDQQDAELVQETLIADGIECSVVRVENRPDFLAAMADGSFDVILADFALPSFDGLSALKLAQEQCPDVPFIFVSGAIGEELAIETLAQGATDYVLKHRLSRLGPAVRRALREVEARRGRQQADEALRRSFEAEMRARQLAEKTARRIAVLQAVTAALAEALTPVQVAQVVVEKGLATLGATAGSICLLDPSGDFLEIIAAAGYPEGLIESWRRFSVTAEAPLSEAVRTGEPEFMESVAALAARFPELTKRRVTKHNAFASIPLIVEGSVIGGMGLSFDESREFDEDDRAFMIALARQCAQALERARLYEAEQVVRTEVEAAWGEAQAAQERLEFLAEASVILAGSLDYLSALSKVAHRAVPQLADSCLVLMTQEDGLVEPVAKAQAYVDDVDLVFTLQRFGGNGDLSDGLVTLLPDDKPRLYSDFSDSLLERFGKSFYRDEPGVSSGPESAVPLEPAKRLRDQTTKRRSKVRSLMAVPLEAREQVLGAIIFATTRSGRHFDVDDLALAEELGRRAALAVENAQLYWQARELNEELEERVAERTAELDLANKQLQEANRQLQAEIAERKRAESKLKERARQLAAFSQMGLAVTASLDLEEVLQLVLEQVSPLLPAETISIFLLYNDFPNRFLSEIELAGRQPPLWLAASSNPLVVERFFKSFLAEGGDPLDTPDDKRMAASTTLSEVIQLKRPVWVHDATNREHLFQERYRLGGKPVRSLLAVPLKLRGQVIGVMEAVHSQPAVFSREDLQLLEAAASWTAIAVGNARLYEAEYRAREIADTLRNTNLALSEQLDLDVVLETLLDHLGRLIPYDSASVMLLEGDSHLVSRALRGYQGSSDPNESRVVVFNLPTVANLRHLITTQQSLVIPDTRQYPGWVQRPGYEHVRSWLGVPLIVGGKLSGVFSLDKAEPGFFTQEDLRLVQALAAQTAIAVQNAQLFEQVSAGREQLRRLAHQIVSTQEEERRRVSRELHDEAGQALTALKISLSLVQHDLPAALTSLRQRLAEAVHLTEDTLEQLRLLAHALRPPVLDALGLDSVLEGFCRDFATRTDLSLHYRGQELPPLPDAISISLYRFLQEALTNVVKHARCNQVQVTLQHDGEAVSLLVEDDGCGFVSEDLALIAPSPGGLGLLGMRERFELLGGRLEIDSKPGHGTRLTAYAPCRPAA